MSSKLPADGERYLRLLRAGLSSLPEAEQNDIIEEVRTHLSERYAAGRTDVLEAFGPSESYAAQFVEEHALTQAVAEGSTFALGRTLVRTARSVGEMVFVLAPLTLIQGFAVLFIIVALLKPFFFDHVGYFTKPDGTGPWIGISDARGNIDVLGWWTIPVLLVPSTLALWGSRRALVALARRRLARARVRPSSV